jgi:phosphoribosylglycinamide formyltransferase-1
LHTHERAIEAGCRLHGCTVHFVTGELDCGPIVAQAAVPVLEDDTAETLHERIKTSERAMLVDTVGRIAREGFRIEGRQVRFGR